MLTNFLRSRRKQKLIEELETNPQPSVEAFVTLAQFYHEDEDFQEAARTAKRGAELYPDSENMLQSRAETERVTHDLEKERLRQKIESYPNPILYARLAELYKVDGQIEAAIRVCRTGIKYFPPMAGPMYLVLGEICFDSGDFAGSRVHLEKAVELDKYNYTALKLLAEVYMQQDMPAMAARRLEDILYFSPGDESITEFLHRAREAAGEAAPGPGEKGAMAELVETEEEVVAAVMPDAAEDDSGGPPAPKAAPREQAINEAIGAITSISGVSSALLVDPYGLVIAADLKSDIDEELAGAMITNVYRIVARSAEPLGIGTFQEGVIEGEGGNIHLLDVEDMILAVFASPGVKMGMLEKTIRDFADRVLD